LQAGLFKLLFLRQNRQACTELLANQQQSAIMQKPALISMPAAVYQLGSDKLVHSRPVHRVQLEAFELMAQAVSNADYAQFLQAGAYEQERFWSAFGWRWRTNKGNPIPAFWGDARFDGSQQPVVGVAWYEALAYARWYAAETGENWRLPTEAQWEAAAQAEGQGIINTLANNAGRPLAVNEGYQSLHGAWYLLGNVWEWCSTRWGRNWQSLDYPYPYRADDGRENLEGSAARVMRGGSWFDAPSEAHASQRARYLPGSRGSNIGFRLVLEA
jgi:iron(II)-dependent oxidoreductase